MGLARSAEGSVLRGLLGEDPGGCNRFRNHMGTVVRRIQGGHSRTIFGCAGRFSNTSVGTNGVLMARRRVTRTCRRISAALLTIVHGSLMGVGGCRRGRMRGS